MRFIVIVVSLFVVLEATVQARPFRRYRQIRTISTAPPQEVVSASYDVPVSRTESVAGSLASVDDALQEVNSERAKRGLKPFLPDPLLNQAARTCAKIRATKHIEAHLSNDFAHLPAGASATAAGCGALEPSWGWGTCCAYDSYTYAGAAWVMGTDGKRYMHLFVR